MASKLLWVGLGGAAGSMLRYSLQRWLGNGFPVGTLLANLAGCFLIGLLWGIFHRSAPPASLRLLLTTGFCGGFTTFSAFSQESLQLVSEQRLAAFFIYAALTIFGGLTATYFGFKLTS
jgi:CrcB protein